MNEPPRSNGRRKKRATGRGRRTKLFLRARVGEPHLFDALMDELGRLLQRRLHMDRQTRVLCTNPHDGEDVLQETILSLWQHRTRFDPTRGEIETWAWTIARNKAISLLRRRRPVAPIQADIAEDRRELSPDRVLLLKEQSQMLASALSQITTPKVQEVLYLRLVAGLTYADVSRATGISESTAAQWVYRLRHSLRQSAALSEKEPASPCARATRHSRE